ncbi:SDR family oxidoreductase [Luteimonas sp. FXH3W]|uniref:SDR family oxidoreductase n=1 Tax=Aquilutibacter rugosus TaxID=3115820 RepID=A0ABU7UZ95_9GAMM
MTGIASTEPSAKGCVIVTGGGRRIGRAVVEHLAANGWDVIVHFHRSAAEAEQVAQAARGLGVRAQALGCDLSDLQATAAFFAQCVQAMGSIQAVVNSAALFEFDRGDQPDWALWQQHQDINLRAPVQLASLLHAQTPAARRRCVVNVIDQKVYNLNPDYFSYTISKIALEGVTRMLALEMGPHTRVCAVAPGITLHSGDQTDANFDQAHRVTPLGRSSTPLDIAQAVAYLLQAEAVTGTTLVVDGGQHLFPLKRDIMFEIEPKP